MCAFRVYEKFHDAHTKKNNCWLSATWGEARRIYFGCQELSPSFATSAGLTFFSLPKPSTPKKQFFIVPTSATTGELYLTIPNILPAVVKRGGGTDIIMLAGRIGGVGTPPKQQQKVVEG